MVQDTSPRHRPVAPPCGMQAPTPPPLVCMQAALSPSLSPQPPPPQCLYDWCHFPAPLVYAPRPARRPPLHARGCRRDTAPLVPSALAMPHARGRATCKGKGKCKGRGKDQGGCMQGEGLHTRGGGGCASERGCAQTEGYAHPFRTLCAQ